MNYGFSLLASVFNNSKLHIGAPSFKILCYEQVTFFLCPSQITLSLSCLLVLIVFVYARLAQQCLKLLRFLNSN